MEIKTYSLKDNNYQFDLSSTAKFVVDYYGYNQFLTNYTGDPKLKLNTTIFLLVILCINIVTTANSFGLIL